MLFRSPVPFPLRDDMLHDLQGDEKPEVDGGGGSPAHRRGRGALHSDSSAAGIGRLYILKARKTPLRACFISQRMGEI